MYFFFILLSLFPWGSSPLSLGSSPLKVVGLVLKLSVFDKDPSQSPTTALKVAILALFPQHVVANALTTIPEQHCLLTGDNHWDPSPRDMISDCSNTGSLPSVSWDQILLISKNNGLRLRAESVHIQNIKMKLLQINKERDWQPNRKMSKKLKQTLHQEAIGMTNKPMERCLASLVMDKCKFKSTTSHPQMRWNL